MISYLKGTPSVVDDKIVLKVNNVGYGIFVAGRLLAKAASSDELEMFIHTHVREDRIELYGFETSEQLKLFEMMTGVSGIGPKTGLEIVDNDPAKIIDAVQNAKISFFTPIPRIGKKTAQKIILELKSKLGSLKELNLGPVSQKEQDVLDALMQLGYSQSEIHDAVAEVDLDEVNLQEAVKLALKNLSS